MPVPLSRPADKRFLTPFPWLCATGVSLLLAVVSVRTLLPAAQAQPHWDQYIRLAEQWEKQRNQQPGSRETSLGILHQITTTLEKVHKRDPNRDEVHLKLAAAYQVTFEFEQQRSPNPMPLSQIRSAAEASGFRSAAELNGWLTRAVGPNLSYLRKAGYHAQRAVQLCPLQGEAYIYLAKLMFLDHPEKAKSERNRESKIENRKSADSSTLIEQATRVRPYSGAVLVEAGIAAVLDGDLDRGFAHWKKAFHQAPMYQTQIIQWLAPNASAQLFLERLQPDGEGLARLFSFYRQADRDDDARLIARPYVEALEQEAAQHSGSEAARQWQQAHLIYRFLESDAEALRCLRNAARSTPMDLTARRRLAEMLIGVGRYEEAIKEIEWCMRRSPKDDSLRKLHADAHRQRLAHAVDRQRRE